MDTQNDDLGLPRLLPDHLLNKTVLKLEVNDLLNIEKSELIETYDVIDSVFKQIRHLRVFNDDFKSTIVRCGHRLKSLVVYSNLSSRDPMELSMTQITLLVRFCPNLEKLPSLGWLHPMNYFQYLCELKNGPSKLRKLYIDTHLDNDELSIYLQMCPKVEKLQLSEASFLDLLEIDTSQLVAPLLRSIEVDEYIKFYGINLLRTVNKFKFEFKQIIISSSAVDLVQILNCSNIKGIELIYNFCLNYDQEILMWTHSNASKIVAIEYEFDIHYDLWKKRPSLTNSIQKLTMSGVHHHRVMFMIGLLNNRVFFPNLRNLNISIRFYCKTLELMIQLINIRGHTIRTFDLELSKTSISNENRFNQFIDSLSEHCVNLKTLKLHLPIDEQTDVIFDHEFYRKLYSIRVRLISHFKLVFNNQCNVNYWKSVEVLQRLPSFLNKTVELEMGTNVYRTWSNRNVDELVRRSNDGMFTEEFRQFIEILDLNL